MKFLSISFLSLLALSSAGGNDYPYKSQCPGSNGVDPWNFYKCQCTSFVAWAVRDRNGVKFSNSYKGQRWGNANNWDSAAKAAGFTVNSTPKRGAIAQSNAGRAGHVAWVSKVDGDKVHIQEYNYGCTECYSTRIVSKGSFNYIHIK